MVTIKITINEPEENKLEVKLITPKNVDKATLGEKETAKFLVEKVNEIFKKKED